MKILLLGGTGAIGSHLAQKLFAQGADVFVTTRSQHNANNNINYILGNAKDIKFLKDVMNIYWDAVVDFMNYSIQELNERIDILLSNTGNYCFISSSRIYANCLNHPISEVSPLLLYTENDKQYLASNEYGLSKAKEEELFKQSNKNNWTIFRPYIIYSENRFQLGSLEKEDWLQRVIEGKKIVIQKSLCNIYTTLTYAPDAAEIMASIILSTNTQTQVYNIVGDNTCKMTWGEIANIYKELLENKLEREIEIEYLTDEQFKRLRRGINYYQVSYDRAFNRIFDNSKIQSFKSEKPYIDIYSGLDDALSVFLKSPKFIFINQAQEALIDRFTGEYSKIVDIKGLKNKLVYLYYRIIKTY